MDSTDFDGQARQHLSFYGGFMKFMAISAAAVAVVLILMAYFLL